jgi:Tfp pilus assembly protein PilO
VARARAEAAGLEERAEAIRANTADLKRFYESVIGSEEAHLVPTLRDIEQMARQPGLRPGPRRFSREAVEDAAVERVAVTVPLEGSYEELVGFLGKVESSPRFLTVDGIALSNAGEGEASLQVELSAYMGLPPGTPVRRRRGGAR